MQREFVIVGFLLGLMLLTYGGIQYEHETMVEGTAWYVKIGKIFAAFDTCGVREDRIAFVTLPPVPNIPDPKWSDGIERLPLSDCPYIIDKEMFDDGVEREIPDTETYTDSI
jgi:hypothetical protein